MLLFLFTVLSLKDTVKNYALCSVYKKLQSKSNMYLLGLKRMEFSEKYNSYEQKTDGFQNN